ncbi:MAG: transposase [Patiriisocius sp.]|jgi:transposase
MIRWAYSNSKFDKNEILFVFEHAGIYSDRPAYLLSDKSIPFLILPGLEIKKSLGTARGKDDKIDAARIALYSYRRRDELKPCKLPQNEIRMIRQLLSLREQLVKQRAGFKANVKEIKHAIPNLHAKSIITCQNNMIKVLSTQIKKIDTELNYVCSKDEKIENMFNLLTSIKGIGPQTALNLIAYTAGFTKFDNWRQFATYCGIAPFPNRSGTSVWGVTRVSIWPIKNSKVY